MNLSDKAFMDELQSRSDSFMLDHDFPEKLSSIYDKADLSIQHGLLELYKRLIWKPVIMPLFNTTFELNLEFQNSIKILEFNKHLSSILGILCIYPDIAKMFFP